FQPRQWKINASRKFHSGPVSFYNAERSAVFTSNNAKAGKSQLKSLQLYFADVSNKEFQKIEEFPYNEVNSSMGHPAINQKGNLLIFTSNMPGGYGGTDLYYSFKENDRWSIPRNFGKMINTAGDEMFPYLYQDSILYFSSNGKTGLGGMDIYYCDINAGFIPGKTVNPGFPLNSAYDDFGLALHENNTGYFTSNRPGKGGDDIYHFQINYVPVFIHLSSKKSAKIAIYENEKLRNTIVAITDRTLVKLIPGNSYRLIINNNEKEFKIEIPKAGLHHTNREFSISPNSGSL
ncbi:MAG: hypothetical protein ACOCWM_01310, partial [Cyclobacteriaceae bacterium]